MTSFPATFGSCHVLSDATPTRSPGLGGPSSRRLSGLQRFPGRPRRLDGSLLLPLDLVAMSRMTYLLTLDAQGLPQLELMH